MVLHCETRTVHSIHALYMCKSTTYVHMRVQGLSAFQWMYFSGDTVTVINVPMLSSLHSRQAIADLQKVINDLQQEHRQSGASEAELVRNQFLSSVFMLTQLLWTLYILNSSCGSV